MSSCQWSVQNAAYSVLCGMLSARFAAVVMGFVLKHQSKPPQ